MAYERLFQGCDWGNKVNVAKETSSIWLHNDGQDSLLTMMESD